MDIVTFDIANLESTVSENEGIRTSELNHGSDCPIDSLPTDVLDLIFEAAHGTMENSLIRRRSEWITRLPVILSQVSRTWRKIAIHSPLLWTFINISRK